MKEVIINELLNRASPVGKQELEKEIREDLKWVDDTDEETLKDYLMDEGMQKVKSRKDSIHKLTELELEQELLKAQDHVGTARGQLGKQAAWEEYRAYTSEVTRRQKEAVQRVKENLLLEGQQKREREAQLERDYNQAQKEAEYAQRIAEQRKKEALDRAEQMSRLQAEARTLRTKL